MHDAAFYLLVDYWAKVSIGKAGGTACCEGDSVGLSAHGAMFVYRNPSIAERAILSLTHIDIDWSLFGRASDEDGGLAYLEEHFNAYCDDAKQNNFHTKSVLDATLGVFLEARPWLRDARKGRMQSDNAPNYRDPTTTIDLPFIGTYCFSEAGMGKDEGDANDAVIKGMMSRKRDSGSGIESANDIRAMTTEFGVSGQTHAKLKVNRSMEDSGISGRDPLSRNYGMWTVDDEYIIFWESLDAKASKETLLSTGRAVGYGPGERMSIKEFNKTQRTQVMPTGAALEMQDGTSTASPNPRQRASKEEKREAKAIGEASKANSENAVVEKAAAAVAKVEEGFARDVNQCARCGQCFLATGWYNRHLARWCPMRKMAEAKRRRQRHVPAMLLTADGLAVAERIARVQALCEVKVVLKAPMGGGAKAIGISLEVDYAGCFIVSTLSGLGEGAATIEEGYVVLDIGGASPTDTDELLKELPAGATLTVTFRRPEPEIPFHGSARKGIHKQTRFKMLPEQEAWLREYVFKDGRPHMRASEAWKAMKAKYSGKMRADTSTPAWLDKDQIATWLASQVKKEKDIRKDKQRKEDEAAQAQAQAQEAAREDKRPTEASAGTKSTTPPKARQTPPSISNKVSSGKRKKETEPRKDTAGPLKSSAKKNRN